MLETSRVRVAKEVAFWVAVTLVSIAAVVFIVLAISRPSEAAELVFGPSPQPHLGTASVTVSLPKLKVAGATPAVPVRRVNPVVPKAPAPPPSSAGVVALGQRMAAARGWTGSQWSALYALWDHESGWSPSSTNPSSGACGIPQRHPCNGLSSLPPAAQIEWGLSYVAGRYGTPAAALAHWRAFNWY